MDKKTEYHLNILGGKQYSKALYLYSIIKSFPWVFYINIKIRKDWFSYWWSTRGANYKEIQIWIFKINIGMPWLEGSLKSKIRDYHSLQGVKKTNDGHLKNKWSFQVGTYPNVL